MGMRIDELSGGKVMNIPIPRILVRAWDGFRDWGNVTVCHIELVRIDLLMVVFFLFSVALYGALYGWLGALKGGAAFVVIAALALFVRRPDTTS
jgi:hypothetical protein